MTDSTHTQNSQAREHPTLDIRHYLNAWRSLSRDFEFTVTPTLFAEWIDIPSETGSLGDVMNTHIAIRS